MPLSSNPRHFRGVFALLATLGAAVLAGVILIFWSQARAGNQSRTSAPPPVAGSGAAGQSTPTAAPTPDSAPAVESGRQPARRGASLRPAQPAPAAVTRAFPSITENVADWREFRPDKLTVAPHPDLPVTFTRTALRVEGRYVTWIGRNPDLPGASFVGVATARGYDAILVMPGASQFSYHVRDAAVVVVESAPGEETCGNDPVPPRAAGPRLAGDILQISYGPGYVALPDFYAETAPIKVDVLVAYDADTLAAATAKSPDPVGYIDGQMKAVVETSNLALAQSLVTTFAWRYLGVVPAPAYTRTRKLADDLDAMAPGGAIATWVASMRYQRGADQVTLAVGRSDDWGGIANASKQKAVTASFASSVFEWGQSYRVISHEWAHNFGCQHDRAHYAVADPNGVPTAAPDSDGFWCYGHLWENPPVPPGFATGTTGDIMSYADWIIPYFSNPNISVHVTGAMVNRASSLELGTHQIGRAETDPKAAYAARVLNDQALAMSIISEEIVTPAITQQPQNLAVQRGQGFEFIVKASGGGLAYQWMKGGVDISGATKANYLKTAEDADVGSYSVKVSNLAGSVTSNEASFTIALPPPPPAPVSSGGGGGGAPSLWFLGLLGGAGLGRWLAFRRN